MSSRIGLIVPVYKNFEGFADLMASVDEPVLPIIIQNWKDNVGVSKGWNSGITIAIRRCCDLALICNDDILFDRGTIHKLRESLHEDQLDLVTPVNTRDGHTTEEKEYHYCPDFSCFMIRPDDFVARFGWFDTNFSPAYFEDNDMAYRMRLQGGKAFARTDAGFFHKGSVTQNWDGGQVVTGPMFRANRRYYVQKWGGEPGMEKYVTPFNDDSKEAWDW